MKICKTLYFLMIFVTCLTLSSCQNKSKKVQSNLETKSITDNLEINSLQRDFMKWWTYEKTEINLSSDFIALNTNGVKIGKEEFFEKMNTGDFIPFKIENGTETEKYRLVKLEENAEPEIRQEIKRLSLEHWSNYKKIGEKFPQFHFTDLNGNTYSNESLKGKTIVMKMWYIQCVPCVAEFPKLNKLVDKFEDRKDIVFISLAWDSKKDLTELLKKKPFNYIVIPDQKQFIDDKLEVRKYPTHIVIGKDGKYQRFPDNADRLIAYLNKVEKNNKGNKLPPPPPPPASAN